MLSVSLEGEFTLPPDSDLKVIQRLTLRRAIQTLAPRDPRILEIGPGPSRDIFAHVSSGDYWILEPDPRWHDDRVRLVRGTLGGALALPLRYFDVICSVSVLEHLPHERWMAAAEQIRAALRVGGLTIHCIDAKCTGQPGDHFDQMMLWREMFLNVGLAFVRPPWPLTSASVFADPAVWSMSESAWRRWWDTAQETWQEVGRPVSLNFVLYRPPFRLRRPLYRVNRALQRLGFPIIG